MMSRRPLLVQTLLICAVASGVTAATVAPPPTLADLAVASEAVVMARAGGSHSEPGGVIPRTVTRFTTLDQLSGPDLGRAFDVVEPGGSVDGIAAAVPGAPRFREGGVYLLFLGRREDGRWRSMMLAWGLLERADAAGTEVLRPLPELDQIAVVGPPEVEPLTTYRSQPLVDHLRQVVREGRAWRPETVRLDGPTVAAKDAPEGCTFMEYSETDNGIRWFDFDTGRSTYIQATTPGQEGIADGAAGGVELGAMAWTDHAGSDILLDYTGVVPQDIECTSSDSDRQSHAVVFNDPCDDIEPLRLCSGTLAFGGPVFFTSTRTYDGQPWHNAVDLFVIVNDGAQCLGETDLTEVLTHEIGHGLGFGHFGSGSSATMYALCCRGWGASLGPKDEECAAYLYPPVGPQPPLAPTGLSATVASATRIDLQWTDRSPDEEAFAVLRDVGSGFQEIATVAANQTAFADSAVGPCTSASYYVVARNEHGDSGPSNTVAVTTGGDSPQVPTGLAAAAPAPDRVDLSWSNGSVAQSEVRVWRSEGAGSFSVVATLAGTATTYRDRAVQPGAGYSYRVQAVNSCGTSAYSPVVSVQLPQTSPGLELGDGRFTVRATWTTAQGTSGAAQPVQLTDDTGYFWFFNADNVEMVLKVLDGCSVNGHFWVFAGGLTNVEVEIAVTDTATGETSTYSNPQATAFAPLQDTAAFATCDAAAKGWAPGRLAAEVRSFEESVAELLPGSGVDLAQTCAAGPEALCLNDDRFQVSVSWQTSQGDSGQGRAVQLTPDTGYFWFFNAANVEMVVKVLRACSVNQHYWVFAGGLTNVQTEMTVVDTVSGESTTYTNPQETPFAPLQDTEAFATCP